MSADRGADESTKAPGLSKEKEQSGGAEDETQTLGTQGAAKLPSPPGAGGSDSGRGKAEHPEGSGKGSGRGGNVQSPPPGGAVDTSQRGGAEAAVVHVEKELPASGPRVAYSSVSRSRKKRKKRAAVAAAAAAGTIEDTNVQDTEHVKANDGDAYPGEHEAEIWKRLETFRRVNLFQRFPVESSPEQLVADLCETYVKTIELTMEMRYKKIGSSRYMTLFVSLCTVLPILIFCYNHMYEKDDLHVMEEWKQQLLKWPSFLYPLMLHLITWPFCTVPLIFCQRNFHFYMAAAYAYSLPLVSICIATGFMLFLPQTTEFEAIIELAIDGAMKSERHLEEASTEATRKNVADVYLNVALWATLQTLVCCYCFHLSMRTVSALRYYKKYSYESDHPARTAQHIQKSALVGQCTQRVPMTKYKNFADVRGSHTSRTPRTPHSIPNSPMAATAVGETTPLL